MRSKLTKTITISALTVVFTAIPAAQALAWCGGGGCWGYGGYYGQNYYPPATSQRYTPSAPNFVPLTTTQSPAESTENDFDPTVYDIQVVLFEKGYYEGEIDGLYSSDTKTALLKFQDDNDIDKAEDADIIELKADKVTLEALGL